jgi:hypothetical protein
LITADRKHSGLLIIYIQYDFTLICAKAAEITGILQTLYNTFSTYFMSIYRARLAYNSYYKILSCRWVKCECMTQTIYREWKASGYCWKWWWWTDGCILNPPPLIQLDSSLVLSDYLQQSGSMKWIMYKSRCEQPFTIHYWKTSSPSANRRWTTQRDNNNNIINYAEFNTDSILLLDLSERITSTL